MIPAVAVTGGIGSGKTTVTRLFAQQGIPVLDLDDVGRRLLQQHKQVKESLCQTFGHHILFDDSSINRAALAKVAFQNKTSTELLNRIMHPIIQQQEMQWRKKQQTLFVIIEASVLIESQQWMRMDAVIVVLADLLVRRQRVLQRAKQTPAMFDAIVTRQCNDQQRYAIADYTIKNNADLATLLAQQTILFQQLVKHYSRTTGV